MKESQLFYAGLAIRLAFLLYGEWQDQNMEVKYTDIDYKVYSDASSYVYSGKSPYLRHTYRYTPALAYILLPNVFIPFFGKLVFILSDLLTGVVISRILEMNRHSYLYNAIWLLNPLVFNISTRGSSDSIASLLILLTVYYIKTRQTVKAGLFFGLAVHFRIYPIIYSLIFYFWVDKSAAFFTKRRIQFTVVSASVFLSLIALFYSIYGYEFLYETYLFHFLRKDNRHNFSIYFYPLYLTYQDYAKVVGLLAFIPQWSLVALISFLRINEVVSMLSVTFIFVIFNKVCTAQYFIWYVTLLPISAPFLKFSAKESASVIVPWVLSEFHWLYWGYKLEILGESCFLQLWLASVLFFIANTRILTAILRSTSKEIKKLE